MKFSLIASSFAPRNLVRRIKMPTALVAFFALSGCVTAGDDFKSETSWLKEGHTKQEDVRMVLGEPRFVGNSQGRPTWTYGYYRYVLVGDSFTKELKLYWNPNGTLSHFSFNSSFPEDKGQTQPHKKGQPQGDGF